MPHRATNATTPPPPDRAEDLARSIADALGLMREAADILSIALAPEPPPEPPPGPGLAPEVRARIQRIRERKSRGYAEDPAEVAR